MKKMKVVVVDGDARVCEMAKRGLESEESPLYVLVFLS